MRVPPPAFGATATSTSLARAVGAAQDLREWFGASLHASMETAAARRRRQRVDEGLPNRAAASAASTGRSVAPGGDATPGGGRGKTGRNANAGSLNIAGSGIESTRMQCWTRRWAGVQKAAEAV